MGRPHRTTAVLGDLGLGLLQSVQGCGRLPSAFAWDEEEVSVGQVCCHDERCRTVGWEVGGRRPEREPPAPPVPVRAVFARAVTTSEDRMVSLAANGGGRLGAQVLPRLAEGVAPPVEFAPRVEIQPAGMAETLDVELEPLGPGEVRLWISWPAEATPARRFGTLVIHHGIDTEPPVRLVWYLRS